MYAMPEDFANRCCAHHCSAQIKHPYFADVPDNFTMLEREEHFRMRKDILSAYIMRGRADFESVLDKQVSEMLLEIHGLHKERAIFKAYDAIAVLMRIIRFLEGNQKLGKAVNGTKEGL